MKNISFCLLLLILFISCKPEKSGLHLANNQIGAKYITHLKWSENLDSLLIESAGEVLVFDKENLPLSSAAVVPTSAIAYLDELGLTDKISGISQPDFIYNPKVHQQILDGKTEVVGTFDQLYIEKILVNKPDILISTSSPTLTKFHDLLKNEGIKILFIDEYEELSPLAKAEYVKLFGKLFGKEKEAQDLFSQIESNYQKIQLEISKLNTENPKIITNQIYGDVWYLPGGKSFQAMLFNDAGANYPWADNQNTGTLNLSFETVFEKANDAAIWVNAGDFPTLEAFIASYKNYEWFEAAKNKNIYNWNQRKTAKGANDYFETGTARPDLVLKDLAAIFHPELFPEHELYFYKKLE